MSSYLPLKNNSVTIGLNFLLASQLLSYHQTPLTLFISLLDYSDLNFHRHNLLFVNTQ